ncbi:sex peptide receptor-like [Dreissena polymorpha]|nr:sex peptide receptor-like [Dreissena polymorpha]
MVLDNSVTGAYEYDDDYYDTYYLTAFEFEDVTLGLVRPIIVIFMALANIFVVGFFLSGKGRVKSTTLLFVSIALSDTLTGISLLPNSFNVYIPGIDEVSAVACNTFMVWKLFISISFHTASIWQTVFLGIQRYLCVCHPFISDRICTFWKTFAAIVIMYMLSFVLHIYQLINAITHNFTDQKDCEWETEDPCKDSCLYLWICVIFQHFLPASLLIGLTIKTLITLQKAQRSASSVLSQTTIQKRISRDRIITITAVLIVICFLVPEIPHGIYRMYFLLVIYIPELGILDVETHHIMTSCYEIALLVSFHANFWIFCTMMSDFRQVLIHVFTFGCFKQNQSLNSHQGTIKPESIRSSKTRTGSVISRNTIRSRTTSINSTTSENIHSVNQKILLTPTPTKETGPPDFLAALSHKKSREDYDAQFDDGFL